MSRLGQISKMVQQVADAIAAALKLEVEVIDAELVRVAATGRVRHGQGSRLARGLVNKYVLTQGLYVFVENAGFDQICQGCGLAGRCYYQAYLVYPITIEGDIIGTIGLMAFDDIQKEKIHQKHGSLVEFVARMAQLISSKVQGEENLRKKALTAYQLEAVVNTVDEGVLAFDKSGIMTHANNTAVKLLGISKLRSVAYELVALFQALDLEEVLRLGEGYTAQTKELPGDRGSVTVIATAKPIRDGMGENAGVVVSLKDYMATQVRALDLAPGVTTLTFDQIIGHSKEMELVVKQAKKVASSNSTVLLLGESGTGKEVFAQAIHSASNAAGKPFVATNCGAIPEALLESELFGYEEGAFTGARRGGKPGKFELAQGGTLLLDEIGSMSLYLQAKLLRVLQERQIERVGATKAIPIKARIIAATNADLEQMVAKGLFREDLFYRLSVIPLYLPPLRQRKEDIPALLQAYRERYCRLLGKTIRGYTEDVLDVFQFYHWPGNVRELINAVEYAVNMEEGPFITLGSIPPNIREEVSKAKALKAAMALSPPLPTWAQIEANAIQEALHHFGWNEEGKVQAAQALGISRATIYRRIQKYALTPPRNG